MFWDLGRSGSFEWVAAEVGVRGVCTSFPGSAEWSEKRALRLRRLESKFWDLGRIGSFEGVAAEMRGTRGLGGIAGFSRKGQNLSVAAEARGARDLHEFSGFSRKGEKGALRLRGLESKLWELGRIGVFEGGAAEARGARALHRLCGFSRKGQNLRLAAEVRGTRALRTRLQKDSARAQRIRPAV